MELGVRLYFLASQMLIFISVIAWKEREETRWYLAMVNLIGGSWGEYRINVKEGFFSFRSLNSSFYAF